MERGWMVALAAKKLDVSHIMMIIIIIILIIVELMERGWMLGVAAKKLAFDRLLLVCNCDPLQPHCNANTMCTSLISLDTISIL